MTPWLRPSDAEYDLHYQPPSLGSIFNQAFVVFHQVKKRPYSQILKNSGQVDEVIREEARERGLEAHYWAFVRRQDQSHQLIQMIREGYRCILIEYDARPYHVNLAILPPPDLLLLMKFPTLRVLTHRESMKYKDRQDLVTSMRAENHRLNWGDVGEQGALLSKLGKPTCSCTAFNAVGCP